MSEFLAVAALVGCWLALRARQGPLSAWLAVVVQRAALRPVQLRVALVALAELRQAAVVVVLPLLALTLVLAATAVLASAASIAGKG